MIARMLPLLWLLVGRLTAAQAGAVRAQLRAALALVEAFAPGSDADTCARGLLRGLAERVAAGVFTAGTGAYRAGVELLVHGQPKHYQEIAERVDSSRQNVRQSAHRLRQIGLLAAALWLPLPGYPGVWYGFTPPVTVTGGMAFCPGPADEPGTCLVYADGRGVVTVDGEELRYQTWLPTIITPQPQGAGAERQRERPATG
jgi:hypothetical protein